jgi:hypothetical protein
MIPRRHTTCKEATCLAILLTMLMWTMLAWGQLVEPPIIDTCASTQNPLVTASSGLTYTQPLRSTDTVNVRTDGDECREAVNAANGSSMYTSTTYGPDMTAMATFSDATGSNHELQLYLRVQQIGAGTMDACMCRWLPDDAQNTAAIYQVSDENLGTALASTTLDIDSGHRVACRTLGNQLCQFHDLGAGWVQTHCATCTLNAASPLGVRFIGDQVAIQNLGAGTVIVGGRSSTLIFFP